MLLVLCMFLFCLCTCSCMCSHSFSFLCAGVYGGVVDVFTHFQPYLF